MEHLNFTPLFLIIAIAWVVPLVLSWFELGKVPSVIVEIFMGVMIGPYVFDMVDNAPYLDFLAEMGFLFLIFLAGLEIDMNKIVASLSRIKFKVKYFISDTLMLALLIYLGTLALSYPMMLLVNQFYAINVLFFTLLFPTVGIGITVPILKSEGELKKKFGQIILMQGAIATVVSILLISVFSGYVSKGLDFELFFFAFIFVAFILFHILGKRLIRIKSFERILYRLEHAASQIKIRGTIALLLAFVMISSVIDSEPILGAFFAGTLLSLFVTKDRSALIFKLDGMSYGFFIPIFFISVGINLDLSTLAQLEESVPFVILLTGGFFLTQIIPTTILTRLFGFKKALSGGVLLSARLGETIAGAQIGLSLGVLTASDNAALVTASVLTCIIAPLGFSILNKKVLTHSNIILIAGNRASLSLAERFKMHDVSFITFIQNAKMADAFESKGLAVRRIKELSTELFDKLELRTGDTVILLSESNHINHMLAEYIKQELGHSKIIMRKQSASRNMLNDALSDIKWVDHELLIAQHIEDMIMRPDAIDSLSNSFDMYRIEEIQVTNPSIHRKLVKDLALPSTGSLIMQRRQGEVFIPHGNTHLLLGDQVTVIGNGMALTEFRRILEGKS